MDNANAQITTFIRADRLRMASFFTDRRARQEHLRGVLIEPTTEGTVLVGTDGHKIGAFHDTDGGFTLARRVVVLPQHAMFRIEKLGQAGYQSWLAIIDGIGADRAVAVLIADPGLSSWPVLLRAILGMTDPNIEWIGQVELVAPRDIRWRAMFDLPPTPCVGPAMISPADLAPFLAVAKPSRDLVTIFGAAGVPYLIHCGRADFVGMISRVLFAGQAAVSEQARGYAVPAWALPPGALASQERPPADDLAPLLAPSLDSEAA